MKEIDRTYLDTWKKRKEMLNDMSYIEYLKSKEWIEIKNKALQRPEKYAKCKRCGSNNNIHLHHTTYRHIHTSTPMIGIKPLCSSCHVLVHELSKKTGLSVQYATREIFRAINMDKDIDTIIENTKKSKKEKKLLLQKTLVK